jgi:hypothetical protein
VAVRLFTRDASTLLAAIRAAIDEGQIDTWSYDGDDDFTHTTHDRQWENRAWLRPSPRKDRLLLNIIFASDETQKRLVYGIYHGRFIEMAVTHFPTKFTEGVATPNMTKEDQELNA